MKFFVKEDITNEVNAELNNVEDNIKEMFEIINSKTKPKVHSCETPNNCPVPEHCWGEMPTESVFNLYRGGKKSVKLYEEGIELIKDIPKTEKLTENQKIQIECAETKKPHINKKSIQTFLKSLKEPIYYLDFETYSLAIPKYDGMKPNQQLPFQFSLHIQNKGTVEHYSYLADSSKDPRKEFMEKLKAVLGTKGSIVVYNQVFEQSRLEEQAELLPEYKKWTESVIKRMVDLLIPFRNFDYYNPKQEGSASIKQVLPVLTGKDYADLEIGNGGDASTLYFNTTLGTMSKEEINKIRQDLEVYCGLDTEGMVWIVEKLKEIVK